MVSLCGAGSHLCAITKDPFCHALSFVWRFLFGKTEIDTKIVLKDVLK